MRDPDHFDAVYAAGRRTLLRQAYALSGDLTTAQAAVVEGYAAAWQAWRRVGRRAEPETWVRRRVLDRVGARRVGARRRGRAEDALGGLDRAQRHVLALQHLSALPLTDLADEAGLSVVAAERTLAAATIQYAAARGVPREAVGRDLAALAEGATTGVTWPSAGRVRRTGRGRRRVAALGAVAATVAVVAGALVITERGRLATDLVGAPPSAAPTGEAPTAPSLRTEALVTAAQTAQLGAGRWHETGTHSNSAGSGLYAPCQRARYADPQVAGVVVREFARRGGPLRVTAVQASEMSASVAQARRTYATALDWYAGCDEPRTSLVRTWSVGRVGDRATVLELRRWGDRPQTVTVGIARTRQIVTTTVRTVSGPGADAADAAAAPVARVLSLGVIRLCGESGAGTCAGAPVLRERSPVPLPAARGLLDPVDLPRPAALTGSWSATDPAPATTAPVAPACDATDFSRLRGGASRTFLMLRAGLPDEFGLTENAARLRTSARAQEVAGAVRGAFASCEDEDLASTVTALPVPPDERADVAAWRVETEVGDGRTVDFLAAVVRRGDRVAQLAFVGTPEATLTPAQFLGVCRRAWDRLPALPATAPARG